MTDLQFMESVFKTCLNAHLILLIFYESYVSQFKESQFHVNQSSFWLAQIDLWFDWSAYQNLLKNSNADPLALKSW